ncbi:FecR domain-containing protein [Luteolibacter sp. Populi]|uniref:FecR domain-containing protein n=1 Tax=Luteolibacter sp. Populi TaxID=3230487 RepID=UPI003465E57E
MSSRPPHPKLRLLVDRLHDGPPLSKTEVAQLEELLEDDDALAYYIAVSHQEALLESVIPQDRPSLMPRPRLARFPRIVWMAAAAVAACLVFALGLGLGRRLDRQVEDRTASTDAAPVPPARITGLVGVEWTDESKPHQIDLNPASNQISIKSGLVEVTYANGVSVTLEGPAVYEVAGNESGRLQKGKLYTTVPKGAEGFKIHYAGGTVEDLGTEFAMDALPDGSTEVGVFSGKIKLHSSGRDAITLFENQSLVQSADAGEPLQNVPLDRKKFVPKLPARDFRWEVASPDVQEVSFDVTHLLWKPAKYRAVFKWINGPDAAVVRNVRLFRDDKLVAADDHSGRTGKLRFVSNNIFALDVFPGSYSRGRWTVVAQIQTLNRKGGGLENDPVAIGSQGILQFEEGLVTGAGPDQFTGRWSYHHMGDLFVREFRADGSVSLKRNGVAEDSSWSGSRWKVENGILDVTLPDKMLVERHVLRDAKTLIFTSNPYENAVKEEGE